MDYQHLQQLQKQLAYEQAIGGQNTQAGHIQPPAPPGILCMTETAHAAFQALSSALTELSDRLAPLVESHPEPADKTAGLSQGIGEAAAVAGLRILVDRIDGKTAEIQRLISALRI